MVERIEEAVDRLLHDAEHADAGADFAENIMAVRDPANAATHRQYAADARARRDRLVREALTLDPNRTASAWQETTLPAPTEGGTPE